MSPLKIALLLRIYSLSRPNGDLPDAQAHAPAMREAVQEFIHLGLIRPDTTVAELQFGPPRGWLTPKGAGLVHRVITTVEPDARPAPPMPKIKPRPDYETVLRDEFAMATVASGIGGTPQKIAQQAYEIADAMMEARNANR